MRRVIVIGGGAAGIFAAITCARLLKQGRVTLLEKGPEFLSKVRISGGGRCNVTHACFDARDLAGAYPRGGSALIGAFKRFQPSNTVEWFANEGVRLKTEPDGRMFPITNSSLTIVECLQRAAEAAGVELLRHRTVEGVESHTGTGSGFTLTLAGGERLDCERVLMATGGCRAASQGGLAAALGHTIETPVPSLFALDLGTPWLRGLAGVSVNPVEVTVPGTGLRERGPLLVTHRGVSGPAILRLSAWGARQFHECNYRFPLRIHWLPGQGREELEAQLHARREHHGARRIINAPMPPLTARLWEQIVVAAGLPREVRGSELSREGRQRLVERLIATEVHVEGKSLNKDEFVTCGGVRLAEVNFKTMESRVCPRLYFAGELLDIDGYTGGFNFQAAWTTGWIAGNAMAGE